MPKTLVVDDDPELAALIGEGLPDRPAGGHQFMFAANGAEALEILSGTNDLDVAVVAIDGDKTGGMGLFRKLKGVRARVPRIALTGGGDLKAIRQAMRDGAVDFLTRPVSLDDLTATIDKVFRDCEERRRSWRTEAQLAALRREMDVAGEIQQRILPTRFPSGGGLELFARTAPAKEMSGDFYDFFETGSDKLGLVVADVSGKGVPAAFFMAVARTLIRAAAETGAAPAKCLAKVNSLLCRHEIPGMFVSVFYAVLDTSSWEMAYANGGHLPPYLIPGGGGDVERLSGGDGTVLGVEEGLAYRQSKVSLAPGDALFFYTDGLTEAFDEQRNQFSDRRLIEYLLENRSLSAHGLATDVFAFVDLFTAGAPQSDDITSLVVKRF